MNSAKKNISLRQMRHLHYLHNLRNHMEYIRINSITDIDTNKISIRQLNQKYIDSEGQRYATRFNPIKRSIEIVHLASSKEEALRIRDRILKEKIRERKLMRKEMLEEAALMFEVISEEEMSDPFTETIIRTNPVDEENEVTENHAAVDQKRGSQKKENERKIDTKLHPPVFEMEKREVHKTPDGKEPSMDSHVLQQQLMPSGNYDEYNPFYEDSFTHNEERSPTAISHFFFETQFMSECSSDLALLPGRQNGVLTLLKRSKLFDVKFVAEFNESEKEIDQECKRRSEKAITLYKELFTYPRPISFYYAKLSDHKRQKLDSAESDTARMDLIKRWELQTIFSDVYLKISHITSKLMSILDKITDDDLRVLPSVQQQAFSDAKVGTKIIIEEAEKKIAQIRIWKKHFD